MVPILRVPVNIPHKDQITNVQCCFMNHQLHYGVAEGDTSTEEVHAAALNVREDSISRHAVINHLHISVIHTKACLRYTTGTRNSEHGL